MNYDRAVADARAEAFCDAVNEKLEDKKDEQLSSMVIAMVVAHSINRLLKQFEPHERNRNFDKILTRLNKMLRQREQSNLKDFVFATEYERILWQNVTHAYDKSTPIFAVNVVTSIYEYFIPMMIRYANVTEKMMEKLGVIHVTTDLEDDEYMKIESNDSSFANTYIKVFESHSGIGLKKSKFAGRLLHIKNNMIIDGIKVKDGF